MMYRSSIFNFSGAMRGTISSCWIQVLFVACVTSSLGAITGSVLTDEKETNPALTYSTNIESNDLRRFDVSLPEKSYYAADKNNDTNFTSSTIRRRRYVRFPSNGPYKFEEPSSVNVAFAKPYVGRQLPYPVWPEYKSAWRNPVMGHRSPRLIFRDDYSRGSASSPIFLSNQIQDLDDTYRGELSTNEDYCRTYDV